MIPPILITGAARSGTSMTAGIIHRCGAFGGRTSGPTAFNRKGMYENAEIRDDVVKPFLFLLGVDPKGQNPLPDVNRCKPITNLTNKIETIMKFSGYKYGPWYYKGAKLCLIWPTWHAAFPEATWIIVRRKDEDIVHSCMKTAFMNAFRKPVEWQAWVDVHKVRFEEMIKSGLNVTEVWPTKFVEGDVSEIKEVVQKLDLKWDEEIVQDFIAPELWGSKKAAVPRQWAETHELNRAKQTPYPKVDQSGRIT